MARKIYYGSWSANNCSTYAGGYEYTNKRTARREMRDMALSNVFAHNTGHWDVMDGDGEILASGSVRNAGR